MQAIAADPHYSNVTVVQNKLTEFSLPTPADVIWTSQNYHDVHNIKDVDVAEESTNFARYNILVQAGTAMLAQANATPQSALRLLS